MMERGKRTVAEVEVWWVEGTEWTNWKEEAKKPLMIFAYI